MHRLRIILRENHTLHEMMIGITVAEIILAVIAAFTPAGRKALVAVAVGFLISIVFVIHMAVTVDDALSLDEKGAADVMRKQMLIRYAFVCVAFALSVYFRIADPLFLTISILMIKAGAYLQPFVHKFFNRRWDK